MVSERAFFRICIALMLISWLVFARVNMARIEKQLMTEGKPRPGSGLPSHYR